MIPKTRRRVFLALLAVALTLPTESILLKALSSQSDTQLAQEWVADLSDPQLESAGEYLRGYSFPYRKEILKRSQPLARVAMIRAHIQAYIDAHPEVDGQTRDVLRAAKSVVTLRAVSEPTAADRASARAVGDQVEQLLGRETAAYLLVWFGPKTTSFFANTDPLRLKLASFVRNTFTANAAPNPACDCVEYFGCSSWGYSCTGMTQCDIDQYWPKCGWFFIDECDQLCVEG